ncbi:methionyl-tRNA synthetase [Ascodesmis nigricans]|uniref:methionine--tRNA ligase n=1 Tax=Ascodesmis nigricans TaxID=341454 RepID=A0A4S2N6E6_9PEZI|nr:methionyl-tRNA synthetase [Ascodesmis nigricans]
MASLKLDIPVPAPKDSEAFTSSLKAVLASEAFQAQIQTAPAPGQQHASLEVPREHKGLIESNAITRYLSKAGKNPWTASHNEYLKDSALIEFEETVLSGSVKSPTEALTKAEAVITKYGFADSPAGAAPSPGSIILFSRIYNAATSTNIEQFPTLAKWFKVTIDQPWAKTGIEKVAASTAVKPTKRSKGPAKEEDVSNRIYVTKIKEGQQMNVPAAGEKILPVPGQRNILITSALPYVNNVPHLGNIIGSVLSADAFARYAKARNYNTLFVCGTDEYGTATETKALEEKVTPRELCDKYNALHTAIYKWFDIGFDYFGRTTTDAQTEISQEMFLKLHENGFLIEESMTQLYCEKHESFLADRFVEGTCPRPNCGYNDARGDQCDACGNLLDPKDLIEPRCKLDGATPILRESQHIFLDLEKLQPEVQAWMEKSSTDGKWSSNGVGITNSWLKEGLHKRCITRDLKWGVPVPLKGFEGKVFYVWFDACIGYVSITANYTSEWKKWWRNKEAQTQLYQFMGKDNVPFHTIVFPATQIGTRDNDWTMLHHISTTEYLQYEGGKFSKSRGIGVFGNSAEETGVAPDVWRYYLLSSRPETGDSQFSWKEFITKNNSELLANLGNFVNRLIKFVNAKYSGAVPDYTKSIQDPLFAPYKESINNLLGQYVADLEAVHIRSGLEKVMLISAEGNRFLQDNKLDNNLFNNFPEKAAAVVGYGLNLIYLISAIVYPYMPATAISITKQLNVPLRRIPDTWEPVDILPGHVIGKAAYLFSNIDPKMEEIWRTKYGGKQLAEVKAEEKDRKKKKKSKGKKEPKEAVTDEKKKEVQVEVR